MLIKTIKVEKENWESVKSSILETYNDSVFSEYCLALKTYSYLDTVGNYNNATAMRFLSESPASHCSIVKIMKNLFPSFLDAAKRPSINQFPLARKETVKLEMSDSSIIFDNENYTIYWERDENDGVAHNA